MKEFDSETSLYVVFSDDNAKAKELFQAHAAKDPRLQFVVVDDNAAASLLLMSLCKHHVLTSSTLSFWGAYLDQGQPHNGRTILHETFFNDHGNNMIPYTSWEVFG